MPFIIFALQVSDNAGAGSYVTLAAGVVCMIIFRLGLRQGKKDITFIDTALFISSFIALERYTIITAAFPVTWTIANTFFVLFLVLRRMQLKLIKK